MMRQPFFHHEKSSILDHPGMGIPLSKIEKIKRWDFLPESKHILLR